VLGLLAHVSELHVSEAIACASPFRVLGSRGELKFEDGALVDLAGVSLAFCVF